MRYGLLLFVLVIAVAGVRLWRSPWSASDLTVIPDSIEYAVGAQRLVTLGRYDIDVAGMSYPPRYPPWFSLLLAPAYVLAPSELGIGILPVWLLALCAVGAAFAIGKRLAGEWGGVASALALACFGEFRRDAMKIMTDVPAIAFGLLACVVYLRMSRGESRARYWLLSGTLCALAFALRLELLALALPFVILALRNRPRSWRGVLAFSAPVVAVALASAMYNSATFGSWRRTGYHFWLPELHERFTNILSPSFVPANAASLGSFWALSAIAFGSLGAWVLVRRRSPDARAMIAYLCLGALPVSLFHFFYFYQDLRFQLLSLSILCVFAGAGVATLIGEDLRRRARWALPVVILCTLVLPSSPAPVPYRRIVAETLARETPRDATIISAIEPAYFEPTLLRSTGREVIPYSRAVEYTARSVRIGWLDSPEHACSMCGGESNAASDPERIEPLHGITAVDQRGLIREWVRAGQPVFLDASFLPKDFPIERILGDDLQRVQVKNYDWLSRLEVRR
jgi:4-amino-4-deoxy-L-arabinose transferase-like glycosyltransferase